MSPLVLYKANPSPPGRAAMMFIDILGLDVEMRNLNPLTREQDTPELIKKNPMKSIPLLDDGDFSLGDSHAIILYLFDKYGKPEHLHLYPEDKQQRAKINNRLFFDCGILFPRLRAVMAPTYAGRLGEMTKGMLRSIEDAYGMIEVYLSDTTYIAGDHMTIADISVVTTTSSLHGLHPIDEKRFPKLTRWFARMNEMDVVKRINQKGAEEHVEGLKALMAHNKENLKSKL